MTTTVNRQSWAWLSSQSETSGGVTNNYITTTTPIKRPLFQATWVSRNQKGKNSLDLNEARDWVLGRQGHQLDYIQTICTSLQTDNHSNTPTVNFYRPDDHPDAQPTVEKH